MNQFLQLLLQMTDEIPDGQTQALQQTRSQSVLLQPGMAELR